MAENKLLCFGENLRTSYNENEKSGVVFTDEVWEKSESASSTIRKTGFIPGTPPSSIALNTALRQAAFGSKVIGDILSTDIIYDLNQNVSTESDNIEEQAENLSDKLISYLQKINDLIYGTNGVMAKRSLVAVNYTEGGQIDLKFKSIQQELNNYRDDLENGQNGAFAKIGASYSSIGTIAAGFTNINQRLLQLENFWARLVPSTNEITAPFGRVVSATTCGAVVYGEITFKYTGQLTGSPITILNGNMNNLRYKVTDAMKNKTRQSQIELNSNSTTIADFQLFGITGSNQFGISMRNSSGNYLAGQHTALIIVDFGNNNWDIKVDY